MNEPKIKITMTPTYAGKALAHCQFSVNGWRVSIATNQARRDPLLSAGAEGDSAEVHVWEDDGDSRSKRGRDYPGFPEGYCSGDDIARIITMLAEGDSPRTYFARYDNEREEMGY